MKADLVEVSQDGDSDHWIIRIEVGEEVIRRHVDLPKDADESMLRIAAVKTAEDEGYTLDPDDIVIL